MSSVEKKKQAIRGSRRRPVFFAGEASGPTEKMMIGVAITHRTINENPIIMPVAKVRRIREAIGLRLNLEGDEGPFKMAKFNASGSLRKRSHVSHSR